MSTIMNFEEAMKQSYVAGFRAAMEWYNVGRDWLSVPDEMLPAFRHLDTAAEVVNDPGFVAKMNSDLKDIEVRSRGGNPGR